MPSDIIAGLVLLRQRQRAKRNAVLDEVGARPLSGWPPYTTFSQASPCCPCYCCSWLPTSSWALEVTLWCSLPFLPRLIPAATTHGCCLSNNFPPLGHVWLLPRPGGHKGLLTIGANE